MPESSEPYEPRTLYENPVWNPVNSVNFRENPVNPVEEPRVKEPLMRTP